MPRLLLRVLVAILTLFGAALAEEPAAEALPADGTPLGDVRVHGLNRVAPTAVERVMELKEGGKWSAEALRRDIQAISNLGTVNPLSIKIVPVVKDGKAEIDVTLEENPLVNKIAFVGNIKYSSERLMTELDYKVGDILPTAARARTQRSLRSFYADGGYKSCRVRVVVTPTPGDESGVDLQITIDEGEKIEINDLILHGNDHMSSLSIRMKVINSGTWLFFTNYYDDDSFDEDLKTIERMYRDDGYLDAQARRGEFIYNREEGWVSPVVEITEGPRYEVREVYVEGATLFTPAEVSDPFERLKGDYYDGEDFHNAIDKLRVLYGNEGYVNARFDGKFEKVPSEDRIDLRIKIAEGDVVYVGKITAALQDYDYDFELTPLNDFLGWVSPPTKEETILREVRLKPAQKYRTSDEVRTIERLKNLGFFDEVNIRREPTEDPAVNDVVVETKESSNAGFLGITAGYGEFSGPAVTLSYTNPNLFGEAKSFRTSATFGRSVRSYSVSYLDRHFRGSDNSLEVDLFRDYQLYSGYGQRAYGFWTEFGHPFSEYVKGYARLRLEDINFNRTSRKAHEDFKSYQTVALRLLLEEDKRDNYRWPTHGHRVSGGIEPGYAGGPMLKFLHTYEWYKSLGRDFIYAYSHDAALAPYDATRVGLSERFFIGGTRTLRGFQPHGVGPVDGGDRSIHIGGSTRFTQRHELRYPFTKWLRGRVFVDAGMLGRKPLDVGRPRASTGTGVLVDVGPVSVELDFAQALLKEPTDRTQFIHFRIGSSF